jgi:hypothetical protein
VEESDNWNTCIFNKLAEIAKQLFGRFDRILLPYDNWTVKFKALKTSGLSLYFISYQLEDYTKSIGIISTTVKWNTRLKDTRILKVYLKYGRYTLHLVKQN